jgi:hypothetical protein
VVVVLDAGGVVVVVVFVVSFVFSVVGLTMVVFVSFFSAGEDAAGATTSVLCSQAPRSAALAKMQINFFIVGLVVPHLGTKAESNRGNSLALPEIDFVAAAVTGGRGIEVERFCRQ